MSVTKYLARQAEPIARKAAQGFLASRRKTFARALIVPAYQEYEYWPFFQSSLEHAALETDDETLLIVVVNAHERSEEAVREENVRLIAKLREQGFFEAIAENVEFCEMFAKSLALILIDCNREAFRLSRKSAVGTARKIGFDLALALWESQQVASPYLYSTDADAILPADYFRRIPQATTVLDEPAFYTFPFRHSTHPLSSADMRQFGELYDAHLRAYTHGLAAAGSPYAFASIGSILAVHARFYAAVYGFPKLDAAEDFYMLNKLAKIGSFQNLEGEAIGLAARFSLRVPFGSGKELEKIAANQSGEPTSASYHPESYRLLKRFRQFCLDWLDTEESLRDEGKIADLLVADAAPSAQLHAALLEFFVRIQLCGKLQALRQLPQTQRTKTFDDWFDGLKTKQFVKGVNEARICSGKIKAWEEACGRR